MKTKRDKCAAIVCLSATFTMLADKAIFLLVLYNQADFLSVFKKHLVIGPNMRFRKFCFHWSQLFIGDLIITRHHICILMEVSDSSCAGVSHLFAE